MFMRFMFLLWAVTSAAYAYTPSLTECVDDAYGSQPCAAGLRDSRSAYQLRPLRKDLIILDPRRNQEKPIASVNVGGSVSSDIFVSQLAEGWVGAYSFVQKRALWWREAREGLSVAPSIFGNWAVLGFSSGTIEKVEVATGQVGFSTKIEPFPKGHFVLHGTTLYVLTSRQKIYAIDFLSGKIKWLFDAGYTQALSVQDFDALTVVNGQIYVGLVTGEILSLSTEGKELWRVNPEYVDSRFNDIVGALALHNDHILFSRFDGLVGSLELSKLGAAWTKKLASVSTSRHKGDHFFVGTVTGFVHMLSAADGKERWQYELGDTVSHIEVVADMVYVSSPNGFIACLRLSDGSVVWRDFLGGRFQDGPVIFGRTLYYQSGSNVLYGYDLSTHTLED